MATVTSLSEVRRARSRQVDPEICSTVEAHAGRVEFELTFPDGTTARMFMGVEQTKELSETLLEAAHDAAALAELEQEGSAKGRRR